MSISPPSPSETVVPESSHRESVVDFVHWALVQLQLNTVEQDGVVRLRLSETDRAAFGGQAELRLPLQSGSTDQQLESLELGGRFFTWLLERLKATGPALHVRPIKQPLAVNNISARLFDGYRVDGGQVHLGGCQLTDFPFLRLSFAATESGETVIRHLFVAHDGTSVSDQLAGKLGLMEVEPIAKLPPRLDDAALHSLIAAGRRVAAQSSTSRDPSAATIDPLVATLVWVKQASGQLQFNIEETTASLPFSGWAALIQPQPFIAQHSGASTFHLAATDDGRVDAVEEITTCDHSGRRILRQELVTCSVTGKQVLEEFTEQCPVSGQPALADEFASCVTCREQVSRSALDREVCTACRKMSKIKKDDPRLVWILGEHTGLDRWNRWQLSETQNVYIAQADSLLKRLLVVVDKETLSVHHLATSGRLSSVWIPVADETRDELLK